MVELKYPRKICSKCGIEKPANEKVFGKTSYIRKDGTILLRAKCKECDKERLKKYYQQSEVIKHMSKYQKQYRKDHKKERGEKMREWRKKNPQYRKRYYLDNKEREREQGKQWYQNNKEQVLEYGKQWAKNNPDRVKEKRDRFYQKQKRIIKEKKEGNPAYMYSLMEQGIMFLDNPKGRKGKGYYKFTKACPEFPGSRRGLKFHRWIFTHEMRKTNPIYRIPWGLTIHHINKNHYDNRFVNLELIEYERHGRYHEQMEDWQITSEPGEIIEEDESPNIQLF